MRTSEYKQIIIANLSHFLQTDMTSYQKEIEALLEQYLTEPAQALATFQNKIYPVIRSKTLGGMSSIIPYFAQYAVSQDAITPHVLLKNALFHDIRYLEGPLSFAAFTGKYEWIMNLLEAYPAARKGQVNNNVDEDWVYQPCSEDDIKKWTYETLMTAFRFAVNGKQWQTACKLIDYIASQFPTLTQHPYLQPSWGQKVYSPLATIVIYSMENAALPVLRHIEDKINTLKGFEIYDAFISGFARGNNETMAVFRQVTRKDYQPYITLDTLGFFQACLDHLADHCYEALDLIFASCKNLTAEQVVNSWVKSRCKEGLVSPEQYRTLTPYLDQASRDLFLNSLYERRQELSESYLPIKLPFYGYSTSNAPAKQLVEDIERDYVNRDLFHRRCNAYAALLTAGCKHAKLDRMNAYREQVKKYGITAKETYGLEATQLSAVQQYDTFIENSAQPLTPRSTLVREVEFYEFLERKFCVPSKETAPAQTSFVQSITERGTTSSQQAQGKEGGPRH